jgi:hypothetical protein
MASHVRSSTSSGADAPYHLSPASTPGSVQILVESGNKTCRKRERADRHAGSGDDFRVLHQHAGHDAAHGGDGATSGDHAGGRQSERVLHLRAVGHDGCDLIRGSRLVMRQQRGRQSWNREEQRNGQWYVAPPGCQSRGGEVCEQPRHFRPMERLLPDVEPHLLRIHKAVMDVAAGAPHVAFADVIGMATPVATKAGAESGKVILLPYDMFTSSIQTSRDRAGAMRLLVCNRIAPQQP